jgi:ketosteroid isomerase-like protein
MSNRDAARSYYTALDDHHYETFESLLTPEFVHVRPDRTLEDRAAFIEFMQEGRPLHTTTHDQVEFYENNAGDELVVHGVLRDEEGEKLFKFLDRHVFGDDRIARVETFTSR